MNPPAPGQPPRPAFVPPSGGNYNSIREKVEAERRAQVAKDRAEEGVISPMEENLPPEWPMDVEKTTVIAQRVMGLTIIGLQYDKVNGSVIALELKGQDGKTIVLAFNATEDLRFLPGIIDTTEAPERKAF
jgi:hypothetical protein